MSRNSTIELLNETDALGYRMRWQLFVQENEQIVYGDYTGWQPGDPLHIHPRRIPETDDYDAFGFYIGSGGNHVRPMIEELPIDHFHLAHSVSVHIRKQAAWCGDCLVSWDGEYGDPCWVCHRQSYGPYIERHQRSTLLAELLNRRQREPRLAQLRELRENRDRALSNIEYVSATMRRDLYDRIVRPVGQQLTDEYSSQLGWQFRYFTAAMQQMTPVMTRFANQLQGVRGTMLSYVDELDRQRLSHYSRVLNQTDATITLDVETFVLEHSLFQRKIGLPREEPASIRYLMNRSQQRDSSASRIWLDEWAVTTSYVRLSDVTVTITIPRRWRKFKKAIPVPKPQYANLVEKIVARHRTQNPTYYLTNVIPERRHHRIIV